MNETNAAVAGTAFPRRGTASPKHCVSAISVSYVHTVR